MAAIEFKDVTFTYPNCENPALKNVSFKIEESEFIVVCGASGSGKTTLLRHMKQNLIPNGRGTGELLYKGQDIEQLSERISASEIGYVQQNPENQIVADKVWHELAFGLESLGESNQIIRKRTAEMAKYFGISDWYRKDVWQLSGGQKQLLNLASIMVMQPKVLILDEPTAQLDPIAATQFIETIAKINRDFGTTIILSEHRLEDAYSMADKVMVLDKGEIRIFDTPQNAAKDLAHQSQSFFYGLPSALKIYAGIKEYESTSNLGNVPITVKDGRIWLSSVCDSFEEGGYANETGEKEVSKSHCLNQAVLLKDINFRYEKDGEDIFRGLNLNVNKGEFFAILGGNGVGKTTLLRLLTGAKKPYYGKVKMSGNVVALPQNVKSIFTEITVEEELQEIFSKKNLNLELEKKSINHNIQEMLHLMDLEKYRKKNPYDLSGGEQQKLALAKVLLLRPDILLLDEPTKGIDPYFKHSLAEIFKKLIDSGVTIIMVSHDVEFCAENATKCALLFDGDIVSQDETKAFFSGNSFYTTAANRISRHIFSGCITCNQVVEAFKNTELNR